MNRKEFLKLITLIPISTQAMKLNELKNITKGFGNSELMPVLFIGHGNPMNALADNAFTKSLVATGLSMKEKPKAILVVSAHWLTKGSHVMVSENPKTIHDFGGFPEELFNVQYPAPGSPELARETKRLITSTTVEEDDAWGIDHGAWTVLRHMFPKADIPVFQLSIDYTKAPEYHYQLAKELKSLRNKGVLIIGSGNIVHNLYQINFSDNAKPFDWAIEFDTLVKTQLVKRDYTDLMNYQKLGKSAQLSIPTNEHYLPMFYSLGLTDKNEKLQFTFEEIQNGSISMRCFQIG
jgi:4,5-DOPA dioxygenase extradiol